MLQEWEIHKEITGIWTEMSRVDKNYKFGLDFRNILHIEAKDGWFGYVMNYTYLSLWYTYYLFLFSHYINL